MLTTSYSNLATIQQDQGDLPAARANMKRAIAIALKHFPEDHPALGTNWHNLAGIFVEEGDFATAVELEERALGILLKHFGKEHPHVKIVRKHLAAYRAQRAGS